MLARQCASTVKAAGLVQVSGRTAIKICLIGRFQKRLLKRCSTADIAALQRQASAHAWLYLHEAKSADWQCTLCTRHISCAIRTSVTEAGKQDRSAAEGRQTHTWHIIALKPVKVMRSVSAFSTYRLLSVLSFIIAHNFSAEMA